MALETYSQFRIVRYGNYNVEVATCRMTITICFIWWVPSKFGNIDYVTMIFNCYYFSSVSFYHFYYNNKTDNDNIEFFFWSIQIQGTIEDYQCKIRRKKTQNSDKTKMRKIEMN